MRKLILFLLLSVAVSAQVPVVMLSDLHFDPLQDPAKAARLVAAPVAQWDSILSEPPSPTQAADFDAVQRKCGQRGVEDASYALLTASLKAAHLQSPGARFVTVTGDLVVHDFECRLHFILKTEEDSTAFIDKTTNFVIDHVDAAFPRTPVYLALGNNDTTCGDYRMDTGDRYLRVTSAAVMAGLRGVNKMQLRAAREDYERGGYFAVDLPGLHKTRLLAIDDQYLSRKYKNCAGKASDQEGTAVLTWLKAQLEQAKSQGIAVWFIAHIPPGVDVYSTLRAKQGVCDGGEPVTYLSSDALPKLLEQYGSTIRLALFGHIHADEMRLIGDIPAKTVGAVTTIRSNLPTFTIGQVDPRTASLIDYAIYVAKDKTGAGDWARSYDFDETYKVTAFSKASIAGLLAGFRADPDATTSASQAYERNFYIGGPSPLQVAWSQYACSLGDFTAEAYRSCVCQSKAP